MNAKFWLLAAATALLSSMATAAPVIYSEVIGGDILEQPNEPTFVRDVGANTVPGTQSTAFHVGTGTTSSDRDNFFFTVPVGMALTGLSIA